MKITSLDGKTPDIAEENIQKLKQIFPDVFTEDKVDFEKLQQVLGDYVEDSTERYNFTWNGKGRALRLSQTPSLGTLRPCKYESKDWDTTQNLYIEGDNLEVLKLLQKSYHSKVKMIYLDPPYNTGRDFVYPDNFHDSLENYKKLTEQVDSNGNRISTNAETSGRYHTDWLNMMYPRLRLARNLLTDDGVVFISIDDNEVDNLKKVCNEVFGEDNFINQVIWVRNSSGKTVSKQLTVNIEYLLIYAKSSDYNLTPIYKPLAEATIKMYSKDDGDGRGKYRLYPMQKTSSPGPETTYDYVDNSGRIWKCPAKGWRMKESKLRALENDGRLCLENNSLSEKAYWNERLSDGRLADTLWDDMPENSVGTKEISSLFNNTVLFSNPKPTGYIIRLLKMQAMQKDDLILDFFSGSSTTADAVMQLNAEDGGNRKFIMVQLPEPTDEKDEAYKAGYMNICEIGKERIRRAGEKIKEEKGLEAQNLDIGFKVLKLDTSNIRKWQPDYDDLEQSLLDYIDNYVEGRTELDVVYEIMIKYGLDLTYPVNELTIADKKVYSIGFGMLMICLDDEITTDVAKGIFEKVKELAPESTRVVFKDNGFKTDSNKTNIKEILKSGGIEEFITI